MRPPQSFAATVIARALILTGCDRGSQAQPTPPTSGAGSSAEVPVSLEPVKTQPVERSVLVVGTLYGDEEATISAKVPGRIVEVHKDVGDRAAAGDALAR